MNAPFHDDAMLDDAMLVDALTAIEYMNGIAKDAASVDIGAVTSSTGGDDLKHEPHHHAFTVDTNAIPSTLEVPPKMPPTVPQTEGVPVEVVASNCPTAASTTPVPGVPPAVASRSVTSPAITQPMQLDASPSPSPFAVETKQGPDPSSSPYKHIVVTKESGLLGFGVLPVRGVCGIQVSTLQPDSSAAKAGLRVGDVLLKLDNTDVASMAMPAIIQILQAVQPGIPLHISLFRPSVAVPMTAPIGLSKPFASSLVQRSSASSLDGSSAPAAKKAKTAPSGVSSSTSATIYAETVALKKQLEALTKDLDAATAEKAKLGEKNGMLRKRVQQMVITGDEDKVKLRAEYDQRIAVLVQEKAALQTTLATVKAQARLDSRAVFDTDVTMEMKTQLDALQRQVVQFEDVDKKRKETRKTHAQIELKLADKYKMQLLKAIVDKVSTELKAISQLRAQSSLRTNAFGAAGTAATAPAQVKVQLELVRRVGVHRLFSVHMATDPLGFPALSPVQLTLPESRIAEVFGKQLSFEERPGLNLVAAAPMEVQYDPTTETLQLVCKWTEQNVIREIARNIRM